MLGARGAERFGTRINPSRSIAKGVLDVFGDPRNVPEGAVRRYQELALRPGNRGALIAFCRNLMALHGKNPYEAEIPRLTVPTLLMWGTLDRWIPPRHVPLWQRDVKGLEVKLYEGIGHVPMEEAPAETARDAREFFLRS